jgi:hypothetical protein
MWCCHRKSGETRSMQERRRRDQRKSGQEASGSAPQSTWDHVL